MPYNNPIVAGTVLVIPAIQSPDYVAHVSGWAIFRDGTAEFNDATIRGELVIGNPPAAGGQIGASIPADLMAFYSGFLTTLANFAILAYPGDGSYLFVVVGTIVGIGTQDVMSIGWSDGRGTGNIREIFTYYFSNNGSINPVMYFGGARTPQATATQYQFGQNTVTGGGPAALINAISAAITFGTGLVGDPSFLHSFAPFLMNATAPIIGRDSGGNLALSFAPVAGTSTPIGATYHASFNEIEQTYTPTMQGGGAVTFSVATGWYYRSGKMVFFAAQFTVNAAGTGASVISVTTPTNIDRTTRQQFLVECEGTTAATLGPNVAVCFTSGSFALIDRIRTDTGANMVGSDLLAGATISYSGWYREQ